MISKKDIYEVLHNIYICKYGHTEDTREIFEFLRIMGYVAVGFSPDVFKLTQKGLEKHSELWLERGIRKYIFKYGGEREEPEDGTPLFKYATPLDEVHDCLLASLRGVKNSGNFLPMFNYLKALGCVKDVGDYYTLTPKGIRLRDELLNVEFT